MGRHHVHLSDELHVAVSVGQRRGQPLVLDIDAGGMYREGYRFYLSENGVWLTKHVPPSYISFLERSVQ